MTKYERLRLTKRIKLQLKPLHPKEGYFVDVPTEIIEHMLSFLDPDFLALSETCTMFRHICEGFAERSFRSKFGTNKPICDTGTASWCRCLKIVGTHMRSHFPDGKVHEFVLYYGLSNPDLLQNLWIDWCNGSTWANPRTQSEAYNKLFKFRLNDTIQQLFIPNLLVIEMNLLLAVLKNNDKATFDAIMRLPKHRLPGRNKKDFGNSIMQLSDEVNNEFLPVFLHAFAQTPQEIEDVVNQISRKCETMQHVLFLDAVLQTYGKQYPATNPRLGLFWSDKMVYLTDNSEQRKNLDVVDAYKNVWLKYRPKLLRMKWGKSTVHVKAHVGGFCNIFANGSLKSCITFLNRHPYVRFDDFKPHHANRWWSLCMYYVSLNTIDSREAARLTFDALFARDLPFAGSTLIQRICEKDTRKSGRRPEYAAQEFARHVKQKTFFAQTPTE